MRTRRQRGLIAWICSQSSPKLPSTRGREVLEHRVALADQAAQHRQPVVGAEVEGEVALVGVGAQVVRAALPPRTFHARARAGGAHAVDAADRLDVDHVGAERGERACGDRARPPRGEVEHPDPRQRQLVGADRPAPRARVCGSIAPVCSPRRGAGRGSGGSSSSMRHGRRGILNVFVASSTNTLRATNWSQSRMFSPLCTGATGMRSSLARRTVSAVVWCGVQAWTMSFHSSQPFWRSTWLLHGSPSMRSGRSMSSRKLWNCWRLLVQKPT